MLVSAGLAVCVLSSFGLYWIRRWFWPHYKNQIMKSFTAISSTDQYQNVAQAQQIGEVDIFDGICYEDRKED